MREVLRRVVLNESDEDAPDGVGAAAAPGDLGEELARRCLAARAVAARPSGRLDDESLATSEAWARVVDAARAIESTRLAELGGRPGRLAFWINVYNALAFHAIVGLGVRRSVREIPLFFARVCYRIGGFRLSLDDIEHGILRGNRRRLFPPWPPFRRLDPRGALALDSLDPRIHFALNCGAESCPPVGVYRASAIDQQLDLAARNFINRAVTLDAAGRVTCSRILRWYRRDFDPAGGVVAFVLGYLDDGPARDALRAHAGQRLAWAPYRWTIDREPEE